MTVYETDLPGVGRKYAVDVDDYQLVVVVHNTGRREVFRRAGPDADAEKLFEVPDDLARTVGSILEGAYFQPVRGKTEAVVDEGALIEWASVPGESPVAGRTLADAEVRRRTGASVIAVQREGETIANPPPETVLRAGDTLVALGDRDSHRALATLLAGGDPGSGDRGTGDADEGDGNAATAHGTDDAGRTDDEDAVRETGDGPAGDGDADAGE